MVLHQSLRSGTGLSRSGLSKKAVLRSIKNIKYFVRFVDKVVRLLGNNVDYIIILNEPNVYCDQSLKHGNWPPNKQSFLAAANCYWNLSWAHRLAYRQIKKIDSTIRVSSCLNVPSYVATNKKLTTKVFLKFVRFKETEWFIKRINKNQDFVAFNYYFQEKIDGFKKRNNDSDLTDLGWGMHPKDIGLVADRLYEKFKKPVMITENGLADANDKYRKWWLSETMVSLARSIRGGTNIIGYLHWSLLDNFEWDKGFWPKFGLVSVDRETMKRTVRPSAKWWAGVLSKLEPRPLKIPKEEKISDKVEAAFEALGYNKDAKSFRLHKK